MSVKPQMPDDMYELCIQIEQSDKFQDLTQVTRATYLTIVRRQAMDNSVNKFWVRKIWQKLYWDWNIQL